MKRLTLRQEACIETLAVLILVAHGDGKLEEAEKGGLRAAASVFNLTKEMRERVEVMLKEPLPLDQVMVEHLKPKEKYFMFVAAAWMAGLDSDVADGEVSLLNALAQRLELDKTQTATLRGIAAELDPVLRKTHNWTDELVMLFRAIPPSVDGEKAEVVFEGPGLLWQ
jgi:uncharacterized membrane protein YebE (DUF533 family)